MDGCYKNCCFISNPGRPLKKQQLTKKSLPELKVSVLALEWTSVIRTKLSLRPFWSRGEGGGSLEAPIVPGTMHPLLLPSPHPIIPPTKPHRTVLHDLGSCSPLALGHSAKVWPPWKGSPGLSAGAWGTVPAFGISSHLQMSLHVWDLKKVPGCVKCASPGFVCLFVFR